LEDVLDAATCAQRYLGGVDLAAFAADGHTLDAICADSVFEIISEIVIHVSNETIAAAPELPCPAASVRFLPLPLLKNVPPCPVPVAPL
jgi:uncharacterized protein with HEPN domain